MTENAPPLYRPPSCCSRRPPGPGAPLAYACGGSGSLFKSEDGGKSWKRDRSTDDVAGNLYAIRFFKENNIWPAKMDETQRKLLAMNP